MKWLIILLLLVSPAYAGPPRVRIAIGTSYYGQYMPHIRMGVNGYYGRYMYSPNNQLNRHQVDERDAAVRRTMGEDWWRLNGAAVLAH